MVSICTVPEWREHLYNRTMTLIMIIGSERDYHARYMLETLQQRGVDCFYFDTFAYPGSLKVNLTPDASDKAGTLVVPGRGTVNINDITAVYWRYHHGYTLLPNMPPDLSSVIFREIDSAIGSLFRNMNHVLWVNPPEAIEMHRYKTHQLHVLSQAGLRIPQTLISNDPDAVRAFCADHPEGVIFKPVAGGAHTQQVKPEDLTDERLKDLIHSPVQFQEMIDGVDIRVYLVGDQLFAAEIRAGTLDFRDNPEAQIVPTDLPAEIQEQCRVLAKLFHYRFTGIDLRRTPVGEFVFIEGNPSPMFVHFERSTGFPITDAIISLLTSS